MRRSKSSKTLRIYKKDQRKTDFSTQNGNIYKMNFSTKKKKNQTKKFRSQKWEETHLYGHFNGQTKISAHRVTWICLKRENWREKLICQRKNDNRLKNCNSRLCDDREESVNRMIIDIIKLEKKEYKSRYDWVVKMIYWELCKPESVREIEAHRNQISTYMFEFERNPFCIASYIRSDW